MYLAGQGVRKNYSEAAKWLRLAAEQGSAEAQRTCVHVHYLFHIQNIYIIFE